MEYLLRVSISLRRRPPLNSDPFSAEETDRAQNGTNYDLFPFDARPGLRLELGAVLIVYRLTITEIRTVDEILLSLPSKPWRRRRTSLRIIFP